MEYGIVRRIYIFFSEIWQHRILQNYMKETRILSLKHWRHSIKQNDIDAVVSAARHNRLNHRAWALCTINTLSPPFPEAFHVKILAKIFYLLRQNTNELHSDSCTSLSGAEAHFGQRLCSNPHPNSYGTEVFNLQHIPSPPPPGITRTKKFHIYSIQTVPTQPHFLPVCQQPSLNMLHGVFPQSPQHNDRLTTNRLRPCTHQFLSPEYSQLLPLFQTVTKKAL